ncbi:hypothetical protein TWF225_001093 [Orbilia oligospora]|nr:hypothetical protein TWF225_001093 [Orbilia oligospora]KAF3256656.1 hypothetical protein TWF217_006342 [Orbilia oligospora]KAF3268737.1 hypothetical protein TWF128_007104 [Orbilia oligospora]KAF3297376.1 hypothetical protein TWF132_007473 [Orbilia oligospora]
MAEANKYPPLVRCLGLVVRVGQSKQARSSPGPFPAPLFKKLDPVDVPRPCMGYRRGEREGGRGRGRGQRKGRGFSFLFFVLVLVFRSLLFTRTRALVLTLALGTGQGRAGQDRTGQDKTGQDGGVKKGREPKRGRWI